ncbi:MAG: hypothetical protein M0Z76_04760 [Gammaproteobacteria bacterium]|nr:hypothetical protein [Gammaproteobacteria bacterium]
MSAVQSSRGMGFLREVFALEPHEGIGVLLHGSFPQFFEHNRMRLVLARTQAIALLFAVLVPLWIFVDMQVFPYEMWARLAVGRVVVSIAFNVLAIYAGRVTARATRGQGYGSLAVLFLIPSLFFLLVLSQPVLAMASGSRLGELGGAVPALYILLPLMFVGGISLFPLTVMESAMVVVPLLAVTAALLLRSTKLLAGMSGLAVLWVAALIGVVGMLAAASQLQFLRESFQYKTRDRATGLLSRAGGEQWLEYAAASLAADAPLTLCLLGFDDAELLFAKGMLSRVVAEVRRTLKDGEVAVWWDYGTLALVLPGPCVDAVQRVMDVQTALAGIRHADGSAIQFSAGLAEMRQDARDGSDRVIPLAELRLRQARSGGAHRLQGCGQQGVVLFPADRVVQKA